MSELLSPRSLDVPPDRSPPPVPVEARPQIAFAGPQPDLTGLAAEKLRVQSDARTFGESALRAIYLSDWDTLSPLRKVWAVAWRVVLLTAIVALIVVGIKFLSPLVALSLIGILVFVAINAKNHYQHNHNITLGAVEQKLAEKTWKSFSSALGADNHQYQLDMEAFEQTIWSRLEAKLCQGLPAAATLDQRKSHFAQKLADVNMESFLHSVFVDLEKAFHKQKSPVPMAVKMRMAYDITENLWARYQEQMKHYPWLENPEARGALADPEHQILPSVSKMIYQRMAMGCALQKYFIHQYADASNPHRPQFNDAYLRAADARQEKALDRRIEAMINQEEREQQRLFSKNDRTLLHAQYKAEMSPAEIEAARLQDDLLDKAHRNLFALNDQMGFNNPIMTPLGAGEAPEMRTADFEERLQEFHPEAIRRDVAEFFRTLDPFANTFNAGRLLAAAEGNETLIRGLRAYQAELEGNRPAVLPAAERDPIAALVAQYQTAAFVVQELERVGAVSPRYAALEQLQQQIVALAAMPDRQAQALAAMNIQALRDQAAAIPNNVPVVLHQEQHNTAQVYQVAFLALQEARQQVHAAEAAMPAGMAGRDGAIAALRAPLVPQEQALIPLREARDHANDAVIAADVACQRKRALATLIPELEQHDHALQPLPAILAADFGALVGQHAAYLALFQEEHDLQANIARLAKIEAAKTRVEILTEQGADLQINEAAERAKMNEQLVAILLGYEYEYADRARVVAEDINDVEDRSVEEAVDSLPDPNVLRGGSHRPVPFLSLPPGREREDSRSFMRVGDDYLGDDGDEKAFSQPLSPDAERSRTLTSSRRRGGFRGRGGRGRLSPTSSTRFTVRDPDRRMGESARLITVGGDGSYRSDEE